MTFEITDELSATYCHEITEMERKPYCPKCKGTKLLWNQDYKVPTDDFTEIQIEVKCQDCESYWQERYSLFAIEEVPE